MTESCENRFWLNPGVEIHADTTRDDDSVVVSRGDRHYRIEGTPRRVLLALGEAPTTLSRLSEQVFRDTSPGALYRAHRVLARLQAKRLVYSDRPAKDPEAPQRPTREGTGPIGFVWRHAVVPPRAVAMMARPLVPIFRGPWMAVGIPIMMAIQCWFVLEYRQLLEPSKVMATLDGASLSWLIILNYSFLFLHELGHAAGCVASGVRTGAIGVCVYLVFPGMYTEVTDSWRLRASRRVLVDAGGIYVSLLLATASATIFAVTMNPVFGLLAILTDIMVLVNANPFLRMDGYWLVTDALELPHLMQLNRAVTRTLVRRLLFREHVAFPEISKTPRWTAPVYYAYYALFSVAVVYMLVIVISHGGRMVVTTYPAVVSEAIERLVREPWSRSSASAAVRLVMSTVGLAGIGIVFWRLSGRWWGEARDILQERNRARFASVEAPDNLL